MIIAPPPPDDALRSTWLRHVLESHHITQGEAARLLRVDLRTVRRWCDTGGDRAPPWVACDWLRCYVLRCAPDAPV